MMIVFKVNNRFFIVFKNEPYSQHTSLHYLHNYILSNFQIQMNFLKNFGFGFLFVFYFHID